MQRLLSFTVTAACWSCLMALTGPAHAQELTWPADPSGEHIRYEGSISGARDLGIEPSFWAKVWRVIAGSEEENTSLVQPLGICVDGKGRLLVSDPGGHCVHVFDRTRGSYLSLLEADDKEIVWPVGIACDRHGALYVADAVRREVFVFDEEGTYMWSVKGPFRRPTGVLVHRDRLYVADTGGNEIFVYSLEGDLLFRFGTRGSEPGTFNYPVFLSGGDAVYVVDAMNHRVQVLTDSGAFVRQIGQIGTGPGRFANPKGIATDAQGNVYVSDALFDAFQVFDTEGRLLIVIGRSGSGPGEFSGPAGMAVDATGGIYVVDALNRRVQVFRHMTAR